MPAGKCSNACFKNIKTHLLILHKLIPLLFKTIIFFVLSSWNNKTFFDKFAEVNKTLNACCINGHEHAICRGAKFSLQKKSGIKVQFCIKQKQRPKKRNTVLEN